MGSRFNRIPGHYSSPLVIKGFLDLVLEAESIPSASQWLFIAAEYIGPVLRVPGTRDDVSVFH